MPSQESQAAGCPPTSTTSALLRAAKAAPMATRYWHDSPHCCAPLAKRQAPPLRDGRSENKPCGRAAPDLADFPCAQHGLRWPPHRSRPNVLPELTANVHQPQAPTVQKPAAGPHCQRGSTASALRCNDRSHADAVGQASTPVKFAAVGMQPPAIAIALQRGSARQRSPATTPDRVSWQRCHPPTHSASRDFISLGANHRRQRPADAIRRGERT